MLYPYISICIPSYKRIDFLERLLESISIQTYKDFEVVITDDSPDASVGLLADKYKENFLIRYFRNPGALGTPENWNEAIRQANGKWIKLMHDDDWFYSSDSLQHFADAALSNPGSFIFSSYKNIFLDEGREETIHIGPFRRWLLKSNRFSLFSKNVIGPPSVCLHRNDKQFWYDRNTKWVVDIDFYMQHLGIEQFYCLDKVCVCVGIGAEQVTQNCVRKPEVEIPENFYLLQKIGWDKLGRISVYDAFWRLLRNLKMKTKEDILYAGYKEAIPETIEKMLSFQRKLPGWLLKNGFFSKSLMAIHYLFNRNNI